MTYSLSILPQAEEDIKQIYNWYESKKEGLGLSFKTEINYAMDYIESRPLSMQIRYAKKIRLFHLKTFPCSVHFTVINSEILVLSVLGAKQSTDNWIY